MITLDKSDIGPGVVIAEVACVEDPLLHVPVHVQPLKQEHQRARAEV